MVWNWTSNSFLGAKKLDLSQVKSEWQEFWLSLEAKTQTSIPQMKKQDSLRRMLIITPKDSSHMEDPNFVSGSIHLKLFYSPPGQKHGSLRVNIIEGKDLVRKKTLGPSDSFVVLRVQTKSYKTKYIKDTTNPCWNEEYHTSIKKFKDKFVEVLVNDLQVMESPECLGSFWICLRKLEANKELDNWYPLLSRAASLQEWEQLEKEEQEYDANFDAEERRKEEEELERKRREAQQKEEQEKAIQQKKIPLQRCVCMQSSTHQDDIRFDASNALSPNMKTWSQTKHESQPWFSPNIFFLCRFLLIGLKQKKKVGN